jgi:4-hydroxy-2-oxoheptanedioate aldolase
MVRILFPPAKSLLRENIAGKLDEGVRVIAGHRKETAILGRAHQKRTMPV